MRNDLDDEANPIIEYLRKGWNFGNHPSPNFDADSYAKYIKYEKKHNTALQHFILVGRVKGIAPISLKDQSVQSKIEINNNWVPFGDKRCVDSQIKQLICSNRILHSSSLDITFIIPDFNQGAGGHSNIFRIIDFLQRSGHKIHIHIINPSINTNEKIAFENINRWFYPFYGEVSLSDCIASGLSGDILFFTDAFTVHAGKGLENFKHRFYLVQDHESLFFGAGSHHQLCENTYKMGIDAICGGEWLKNKMEKNYGSWARCFRFAVDDIYKNIGFVKQPPSCSATWKIALYARQFTTRRGVEFALIALKYLNSLGLKFEVHAFGSDKPIIKAPFKVINHGILSHDRLADLYSKCDIGLCLSFTNYSIIPNEMMAVGLPVIDIDTECNRDVYPADVIFLSPPSPVDLAKSIFFLCNNPVKYTRQSEKALSYSRSLDWNSELKKVGVAISERLNEKGFYFKCSENENKKNVSIVIPTYNAGPKFNGVLQAIANQNRYNFKIELIVIDSGSSDDTIKYLNSISNIESIKTLNIDKNEFQHGATRNLGASVSTGEYIVFITQDALPSNRDWLYHLVSPFAVNESIAGVFSKHLPYAESSPFTKRDLHLHFENLMKYPIIFNKNDDNSRWINDQSFRQAAHFYSDNSSAMRKSMWELIPYPEINFGEDQVWANQILEAGYSKYYSIHSAVFHSHDYSSENTFKRCVVESSFYKKYFGYDLAPNDPCRTLEYLNSRDSMWGFQNNISDHHIEVRLLNNAAMINGHVEGSKLSDVPNYF